jgi:hypothetical protein
LTALLSDQWWGLRQTCVSIAVWLSFSSSDRSENEAGRQWRKFALFAVLSFFLKRKVEKCGQRKSAKDVQELHPFAR